MAEFGPPEKLTRDDLIALFDRNFEDHWFETIRSDPSSFAAVEGLIAALLRLQDAVDENLSLGSFILTAQGAAPATTTVRLTRNTGAAGNIPANTRFADEFGNVYRTDTITAVAAVVVAPQIVDIPVTSEREGYYLNSFGPPTFRILDALFDSNLAPTAGPTARTGGRTAFLDAHGAERLVPRAPGETDGTYRNRMLLLQDAVSPEAITATVISVLNQFTATQFITNAILQDGLRPVVEPFRDFSQNRQRGLYGEEGVFADAEDALDDPFGGRIRSLHEACGHFYVLLPTIADTDAVAALVDELDRRRGHCVRFCFLNGFPIPAVKTPNRFTTLISAGSWADTTGLTTAEALGAAVEKYDGDDTYATSTVAGALVFSVPGLVSTPASVQLLIVRAQVKRTTGTGTDPAVQFRLGIGAASQLIGSPLTIDHTDYREYTIALQELPGGGTITPAAVANTIQFGIEVTTAGEPVRVSELVYELQVTYA